VALLEFGDGFCCLLQYGKDFLHACTWLAPGSVMVLSKTYPVDSGGKVGASSEERIAQYEVSVGPGDNAACGECETGKSCLLSSHTLSNSSSRSLLWKVSVKFCNSPSCSNFQSDVLTGQRTRVRVKPLLSHALGKQKETPTTDQDRTYNQQNIRLSTPNIPGCVQYRLFPSAKDQKFWLSRWKRGPSLRLVWVDSGMGHLRVKYAPDYLSHLRKFFVHRSSSSVFWSRVSW